jgi:hypothetical protein
MEVPKIMYKIKNGFIAAGGWFSDQIKKLWTAKGAIVLLCKITATQVLDRALLFYNGGNLHMSTRKTRCGKEIELDKYKEHMETCQECVEKKLFYEKLINELQAKAQEEEEIEKNIEQSEVIVDATITAEELIKMAIETPKLGKKLQRLYNKHKPKIKEVKEVEIAIAEGKIGRVKNISQKLKKGLIKVKTKTKDTWNKTKTNKGAIISVVLFGLSYLVKVVTGFSILGSIWNGLGSIISYV